MNLSEEDILPEITTLSMGLSTLFYSLFKRWPQQILAFIFKVAGSVIIIIYRLKRFDNSESDCSTQGMVSYRGSGTEVKYFSNIEAKGRPEKPFPVESVLGDLVTVI